MCFLPGLLVQVLEPVLCTRRWLHEVPVWKDCHDVLVGLIRWAGQHSPGVAEGAWQQLMSTLHGYLTASESDSHTSATEVERMDVEVCPWVGQLGGAARVIDAGLLSSAGAGHSDPSCTRGG